MQIWVAN
ncbi:hypothetical protein F383_36921 [Gossypium arboreum]|nr:hypothetical protein F383_36921 [Gossypium arboreum]